jgi:hypothetical protein
MMGERVGYRFDERNSNRAMGLDVCPHPTHND